MCESSYVRCYQQGPVAVVLLNRPKQLNALTTAMNQTIKSALMQWQNDPSVKMVLFKSASERAFCAGGDIKDLYHKGLQNPADALAFFTIEYALNAIIANYPKLTIAFCQGITMGGGCGIGLHVRFAIAGDRIKLAMPETKIGLYPDIGASYLLPRLPHYLGYYLGLTGESIGQQDVLYTGLMQYAMTDAMFLQFEQQLFALANQLTVEQTEQAVQHLLAAYQTPQAKHGQLHQYVHWIDAVFQAPSLAVMMERLQQPGASEQETQWRAKTLAILHDVSPHSLVLTWQAFQQGAHLSLTEVLAQDLKRSEYCLHHQDFYIGVKACLIDREKPVWSTSLDAITKKE